MGVGVFPPSAVKIVLKGDRNTGKTCLFNRMGGKPFQEAYIPTTEIQVSPVVQYQLVWFDNQSTGSYPATLSSFTPQVTSILWSYKGTHNKHQRSYSV